MTKYIKPFLIILSVTWWIAVYFMESYYIYYPSENLKELIGLNTIVAIVLLIFPVWIWISKGGDLW